MKKLFLFAINLLLIENSITAQSQNRCVLGTCKAAGSHYAANYNTGWFLTDNGDGIPAISTVCSDSKNGTISGSGASCDFLTATDGRELRLTTLLPSQVSDNNWTMDFALNITTPNGAIGGLPSNAPGVHLAILSSGNGPLYADCGGSKCVGCSTTGYPPSGMNAIWVNLVGSYQTCGSANNIATWSFQAFARQGSNTPLTSGQINLIPGTNVYYIRLQRSNGNAGMLSVFSDNCFSAHIPGSPSCFSIPPNVTALNHLSHAVADYGSCDRVFNGTISNLLIDNLNSCPTALNPAFNITTCSPGRSMPASLVLDGSMSTGSPYINYHYWEAVSIDVYGNVNTSFPIVSNWYPGSPSSNYQFPAPFNNSWIDGRYCVRVTLALQSCGNVWSSVTHTACCMYNPRSGNTDITSIASSQNILYGLNLFPNPSSGKFLLTAGNDVDKNWEVEITDLTGKLIYNEKISLEDGKAEVALEVENGIYFVKVSTEDKKTIFTHKLIVQK